MRFQKRDGDILQAIYDYDGVLAKRHIKTMFWPDMTWRAMEIRLSQLYQYSYLDWASIEQRKNRPIPEPVCWLGCSGILWVASQQGVAVERPKQTNESCLRQLDRELREYGIRWVREPHWNQLKHDVMVVDIRLAIEGAVKKAPSLKLETWFNESTFRTQMDVVEYTITLEDKRIVHKKRGVRPDGYCVIADNNRQKQGLPARARFLLELDLANHDNPSFGREKVVPSVAYLKSQVYKARFGVNAGRWLVVTTSETRLKHLMSQTREVVGSEANIFLFATFTEVITNNVLTSPIWWQVGSSKLVALL